MNMWMLVREQVHRRPAGGHHMDKSILKSVSMNLLIAIVQIILRLEIIRVILSNISHTLTLWRCTASHVVHIALRLGMSRSTWRFFMINKGFTIPRCLFEVVIFISLKLCWLILKFWPVLYVKVEWDSRVA